MDKIAIKLIIKSGNISTITNQNFLTMNISLIKRSLSVLLAGLLILLTSHTLEAQRSPGDVGIGIQAGVPTGLSIRTYNPGNMNFDLLAAWDLDDFFFVNIHGIFENHIGNSQVAHVFYGPGGFIGIRDRGSNEVDGKNDVDAGISGTLGLGFMIDKFEIYGRVTPRLSLIDNTNFDLGGGVGFRFYF